MFKSKLLAPLLRQRNAVRIIRYNYSSLRRPRQLGPRSRVLNHVETLRPKPARIITEEMTPKAATDEGSLLYDKAAPNNVQDTVVEVPIDDKHQIIKPDSRGAALLTQSAVIVCRQIEMMNVFLGYEQANRYKVMDPHGNLLAYILEEEGFGKSISRQFLRTHRKMNATVLSPEGDVMFKIVRPYSLVNSRIFIYTAEDELVGEVQQRWHLLRRKYDLFIGQKQFATIDTPFLGWDFHLQDENGGVLGNVNRNFVGFARELFTDTGEYVLRMDAAEGSVRGMTLDERAVTLACAVSIDFDYFSRHSTHGGGGFLPFPMFGYGNETREDPVVQDDQIGMNEPPSVSSPPPNTNEYGDPWLTDEQAGVSSPDDNSFMDVVSGFFKDNE
ncbi:hypothetical protein RMATCC62417_03284 [Rhizopus microsporus]|nr:hypothetical protein RMATCC62417_03284 [Rhizopus microsporus]